MSELFSAICEARTKQLGGSVLDRHVGAVAEIGERGSGNGD